MPSQKNGSKGGEMDLRERSSQSVWSRHHRLIILSAVPLWVIFIVSLYLATRPQDTSGTAANVLKVGALPVT
jgi:hypothetical protein